MATGQLIRSNREAFEESPELTGAVICALSIGALMMIRAQGTVLN